MKKILIISYEFPPFIGGAGTYTRDLSVGLIENNCQVDIITCQHVNEDKCKNIDNPLKKKGININRVKTNSKYYYVNLYVTLILKYGFNFHTKFDQIILADLRAKRFMMTFAKYALSNCTSIFHGDESSIFLKDTFFNTIFQGSKNYKYLLENSNLVSVSNSQKKSILKHFPNSDELINVIYNGIDETIFQNDFTKEIQDIKEEYNIKDNEIILFSASRLVQEKGQDNLLKAFSMIKEKENYKLFIAGDGEYRKNLEQFVEMEKLEQYVIFLGALSRERIAVFMHLADVFILTSRHDETFGLVYIEANASKTPVIASNMYGALESVKENITGVFCNPYSIESISEAIIKMSDKEKINDMSRTSYEYFMSNYTAKIMAKNILEVIFR